MLYQLKLGEDKLEVLTYKDFASFGKIEKDLENLIANNMFDVLFEDSGLMPIFQERQRQKEADIYALNREGELIIFELKRSCAKKDAVQQALRYAQDAGQWGYSKLQDKYKKYSKDERKLTDAHQAVYDLEHALLPNELNNKQHLIIIGSAADDNLIATVDYWKRQGISIDFLPYRIYEIGDRKYFEFFATPYDKHNNPGIVKGVLFDTNKSWDKDSIWYMMENHCVAAFGAVRKCVERIYPGDIVFFSHKGVGLVAAAEVKNGKTQAPNGDTLSRKVEFLTDVPQRNSVLRAMPFRKVTEITNKTFFWARTIKEPCLSKDEAKGLLTELKKYLDKKA